MVGPFQHMQAVPKNVYEESYETGLKLRKKQQELYYTRYTRGVTDFIQNNYNLP